MTSVQIGAGGDIRLEGGDLVLDEGIVSAVLVSLLCDARAPEVSPERQRGYWADRDPEGAPLGSLLWLLERGKQTAETAARARDYAERALEWLVTEGIASSVNAVASFPRQGWLVLDVEIVRGTARRWAALWDGFESHDHEYSTGAIRIRGAA
ncbi:MAG: phage GP46 family protein [Planctomycetota bacterium]